MTTTPDASRLSARKRTAIMAAAVDIFARDGFDQASMDSIAERAQVSKRTVYNHFNSKDTLFNAIVQELKQGSQLAGTLTYREDCPLGEQLTDFGRRVIDFHCHPQSRRLARVILPRLLQSPSLGRQLFGDARLFERDLQQWLRQATRAGCLKKADATMAARQFLGLLESFAVWPQLTKRAPSPTAVQRKQIVEETVKMFLARYQGS